MTSIGGLLCDERERLSEAATEILPITLSLQSIHIVPSTSLVASATLKETRVS